MKKRKQNPVGAPIGNSNAKKNPADLSKTVAFNVYSEPEEKENWKFKASEAGLSLSRWVVLQLRKAK